MQARDQKLYQIVFTGVMSAIVFVITIFRIPFAGTYLHLANAMCLLGGLLFGPMVGGLSAGLGSGLYDIIYGYGPVSALITFVSKGAMGLVAGLIAHRGGKAGSSQVQNGVASVVGAFTYVALYMLKSVIEATFVQGLGAEGATVAVAAKLPGSSMNAVAALIIAPILCAAIRPALIKGGMLGREKGR